MVIPILTAPTSIKISVGVCANAGSSSLGGTGLSPHSVLKVDYVVRPSITESGLVLISSSPFQYWLIYLGPGVDVAVNIDHRQDIKV